MRQRNDTKYELDVSVWPTEEHPEWWPFRVGVGEEIDFPKLIGGLTSLEEPGLTLAVGVPRERDGQGAAAAADMEAGEPQ